MRLFLWRKNKMNKDGFSGFKKYATLAQLVERLTENQ